MDYLVVVGTLTLKRHRLRFAMTFDGTEIEMHKYLQLLVPLIWIHIGLMYFFIPYWLIQSNFALTETVRHIKTNSVRWKQAVKSSILA